LAGTHVDSSTLSFTVAAPTHTGRPSAALKMLSVPVSLALASPVSITSLGCEAASEAAETVEAASTAMIPEADDGAGGDGGEVRRPGATESWSRS